MKVKSVVHQKKSLSELTFDDGEKLLIDTELLAFKGIGENSQIDNIQELVFESDFKRAKSRALWYLQGRDYSEKELLDKLVSGGFSEEASLAAIEKMRQIGYVNDENYARRLYSQLVEFGSASKREAFFKLRQKGIDSDLIKQIAEEYALPEDEKIKAIIERKHKHQLESPEKLRKVFAALVRKGFEISDIKKAIREYNQEIDCEED